MASTKSWSVYLLRCNDGTLYTGVAVDVAARLKTHNEGKGAKYTRVRRPVELVYQENNLLRGDALRREMAIKRLDRAAKLALIQLTPDNPIDTISVKQKRIDHGNCCRFT